MRTSKKLFLIVIAVLMVLTFFSCKSRNKTVDYSEYPFTDTLWTRHAEHDIENIRFGSDGSFSYWCDCGNSVNDSDLNSGYTYDDETKIITISYIETTEETISQIVVEMCDGDGIKLNFDGEIREFVKVKN